MKQSRAKGNRATRQLKEPNINFDQGRRPRAPRGRRHARNGAVTINFRKSLDFVGQFRFKQVVQAGVPFAATIYASKDLLPLFSPPPPSPLTGVA